MLKINIKSFCPKALKDLFFILFNSNDYYKHAYTKINRPCNGYLTLLLNWFFLSHLQPRFYEGGFSFPYFNQIDIYRIRK